MIYCGFDFGTSNTVVTVLDSENPEKTVSVASPTLLYMPEPKSGRQELFVGDEALKEYLERGSICILPEFAGKDKHDRILVQPVLHQSESSQGVQKFWSVSTLQQIHQSHIQ